MIVYSPAKKDTGDAVFAVHFVRVGILRLVHPLSVLITAIGYTCSEGLIKSWVKSSQQKFWLETTLYTIKKFVIKELK